MDLIDIHNRQKKDIETHIEELLDLQFQTEKKSHLALQPVEREKYNLKISEIKSDIENYKRELEVIDDNIKKHSKKHKSGQISQIRKYQVNLDYSLSDEENNAVFQGEVGEILNVMGFEIEDVQILGTNPQIFFASQEGDLEPIKALFQCVHGIIDETTVTNFYSIYHLNRERLGLPLGRIITNTYIATSARTKARECGIGLMTFEELLDKVLNVTRYLNAKCIDYKQNNQLFHNYIEIKYLRKGTGAFKDNKAYPEEFLVTESSDRNNFEAKGELTLYVDNWLSNGINSQICLLGDYGTGKTSFANHYFYKKALSYLENPLKNRIPLLITLSRYHKSADIETMITDFLANECSIRKNVNFKTFLRLAERGKILLILDGFDEMAQQVDATIRKYNFKEISRLIIGNNKVILSGRPNYFLTKDEMNEILDYGLTVKDPYKIARQKVNITSKPKYEILNISLFDRWQIKDFLETQSQYLKTQGIEDWRDLEKTIYKTYNLEELARTPVLLEIIIKTISEIRGKVTDINAAKLYKIYTDFWLDREYEEKGEVRWLINKTDKEFFVFELSWQMLITENLNPEIHFSNLSENVRNYFGLEKSSEIEYFSSDIRTCSYLIHSEIDGNYKFVHKSFMEYFSACYIYKALLEDKDVNKITTDKPITDEVFFFLCQIINEKDLINLQIFSQKASEKNAEFLSKLTVQLLDYNVQLLQKRGDLKAADNIVDQLIKFSISINQIDYELKGHIQKGYISRLIGDYVSALNSYETALTLAKQTKDKKSLNIIFNFIGVIHSQLGDYKKALEYYQRAINISKEIGNKEHVGITYDHIGTIHSKLGNLKQALEFYQRALGISEELGDKAGLVKTYNNLGMIYYSRSDHNKALEFYQSALKISEELGDKAGLAKTYNNLGMIYYNRINHKALEFYQRALEISEELGDKAGLAKTYNNLGMYYSHSNHNKALEFYQSALKISEELGNKVLIADIYNNLGIIYYDDGNYTEALKLYQNALKISKSLGLVQTEGNIYSRMGKTYESNGDSKNALIFYKMSLKIFERLGERKNECAIYAHLGKLYQKMEKKTDAIKFYSNYFNLMNKLGCAIPSQILECYEKLISFEDKLNPFTEYRFLIHSSSFERENELEKLCHYVQTKQNLMLIGENKMGKTPLLYQLRESLEYPFIPLMINLLAVPKQTEEILNDILEKLIKELLRYELISSENWKDYSITYAIDFVKALKSLLDKAKEKSPEIKIVFLLDEADIINEIGTEFRYVFKEILQANLDIVVLLTGTSRLLKVTNDNRFVNLRDIFKTMFLKPLSQKEVEKFITLTSKQVGVEYEENSLVRIYELSGGFPLYCQMICYELINLAIKNHKNKITLEDVNTIVPRILRVNSINFEKTVRQLNRKNKDILSAMANKRSINRISKTQLINLENMQLIVNDNGIYRFTAKLFEEWCKITKLLNPEIPHWRHISNKEEMKLKNTKYFK